MRPHRHQPRGAEPSDTVTDWRGKLIESLFYDLTPTPPAQVIESAVEQVLRSRGAYIKFKQQHRSKLRPSEVAREAVAKAEAIERCIKIVEREIHLRSPALWQIGTNTVDPSVLDEEVGQVGKEVVHFLRELAFDLRTNPYGVPTEFMFFGPGTFHVTPAKLKRAFVASLMLVWSGVRMEPLANVKIGSADYESGVLGFLAATAAPRPEENEVEPLMRLATMRKHALELKQAAIRYDDEVVRACAQIVENATTI